jgi:hypothetical protein
MYLIIGEQSGEVFSKVHELWKARAKAIEISKREKVSIVRNIDRFKILTYFQDKMVLENNK